MSVRLALSVASHVRAEVLDVTGRVVARIADARLGAGEHALRWNGSRHGGQTAAAGLYFLRVVRDGSEARVVRFTRLR
jgi:flagellar hook assembly protein FlgD